MTIAELREKCNAALVRVPRDVIIVSVVILSGFLGFGLGYLSGREAEQGSGIGISDAPGIATSSDMTVVASKNGTRYYFPWCAGADRIADANRISFPSPEAARQQGYAPAGNCSGL